MAENDETSTDANDETAAEQSAPQEAESDATTAEATEAEQDLAEATADAEEEDHEGIALQLARGTRDELAQALAIRSAPGGGRGKIDPVHVERLTQRLQAYSLLALAEQGHGSYDMFPGPGREGTTSISFYGATTDVSQYDRDGQLVGTELSGDVRDFAKATYAGGTPARTDADGMAILEDRSGTEGDTTPGFGVESTVETTPEESSTGGSGSNVPVETPTKARASRKR